MPGFGPRPEEGNCASEACGGPVRIVQPPRIRWDDDCRARSGLRTERRAVPWTATAFLVSALLNINARLGYSALLRAIRGVGLERMSEEHVP